jgi:hypothetical protein
MTDTRRTGQQFQTEVLGVVRMSQEMLADAINLWADTVQSITPSIPMPNLPYSDTLYKPEAFVAGAYDFAEQMLISQRKFTESWLEATRSQRKFTESLLEATRSQRKFTESWLDATKPLLGAVNGMAAKKGATR